MHKRFTGPDQTTGAEASLAPAAGEIVSAPAAEHAGCGDEVACSRRWTAVGGLSATTFVLVTSQLLPVGMLSAIGRDLDVEIGHAGAMMSVPGTVAAVVAPALVLLGGSVDRRRLLLGLSGLFLLSNLVVCIAPTFAGILLGRALLGAALGGFWAVALAAARRLVRPDEGARATTIVMAGISLGSVVGVPAGALASSFLDWRSTFAVMSAAALAVLAIQFATLPPMPTRTRTAIADLIGLFRVPRVLVGFVAVALVSGGHYSGYTFLEPALSSITRLAGAGVSATFAVYGASGVLGLALGARIMRIRGSWGFAAICGSVGFGMLLFFAAGRFPMAAVPVVAIWGAAFGAVPLGVQLWTHRAAPERYEAGAAWIVTIIQGALAAGGLLGGVVVGRMGLASGFAVGGILGLLAGLLVLVYSLTAAKAD
ncbi:MFS transporter [Sphingomonas sp. DT-51]|uniref:MFS transporter n=1 Tax=Sphingomonas sp. DT-51 TaxID=3396165 RepID=UPI003F193C48